LCVGQEREHAIGQHHRLWDGLGIAGAEQGG